MNLHVKYAIYNQYVDWIQDGSLHGMSVGSLEGCLQGTTIDGI
jgi:hypothetical protein